MMDIQICVGSSCHLKGSEKIVNLFQQALADHHIEGQVNLGGSFCTGQCNRVGVTITVNGKIHTGITPEDFDRFFRENVLAVINQ